jgi:hypothetical protein
MKYFTSYFLIIALWVTILILPCNSFGFQNEPDSFRGIKWGTNINDISGMTCFECNDKYQEFYIRKGDKMKIGDAEIKHISYGFYKGRFLSAIIKFEEHNNFKILESTHLQLFGKGNKPNPDIEAYYWRGRNVGIALEYDGMPNKGLVFYHYLPLHEEFMKDKKEADDL